MMVVNLMRYVSRVRQFRRCLSETGNAREEMLEAWKDRFLPKEIQRMDAKSIDIYKQALTEGKEKVHNIRVMVVGHFNVGKTSLTKRLLGESVDINSEESTNGIQLYMKKCKVSIQDGMWIKLTKDEIKNETSKRLVDSLSNYKQSKDTDVIEPFTDSSYKTDAATSSTLESSEVIYTRERPDENIVCDDEEERVVKPSEDVDSDKLQTLLEDIEMTQKTTCGNEHHFANLSIWDFAGQYVFYATHQVFLSPRAVYLLVTDMSKHIDDVVIGDDSYFNTSGSDKCKISDYVSYWMNSIHGYCPSDKTGVPPVILVGTHADKLNKNAQGEMSEIYFDALRNFLSKSVTLSHLADEEFAVNNTIADDPAIDGLKKKILEVASQQEYWGEWIPVKWITLERALDEPRDRSIKVIGIVDIESINSSLPVPLRSPEELQVFLQLQHDLGTIVYFSDEGLNMHVLLDPQWTIDAFKCLITAKRFCKKPTIFKDWQEFNRKGILKKDLVDFIWKNEENESFYEHRHYLIRLMEKLDIIAKPRTFNEDMTEVVVLDYFYAPSVLKETVPSKYLIPSQTADPKSTSILCFTDSTTFLHPSIYHRLLAACLTKWSISTQNDKHLIFCGCGVFDNKTHRVTIYFLENVIQIWVTQYSRKTTDPDVSVCAEVRQFVEQTLQQITQHLGQSSRIEAYVKCPHATGIRGGLLPVSEFLKNGECPCSSHDEMHVLTFSEMLLVWGYRGDDSGATGQKDTSVLSDQTLDRVPSEKEIVTIANRIGNKWQQLTLKLGLSQADFEQAQANSPYSVVDQGINILIKWVKNSKTTATFRELESAMRQTNIDTMEVFKGIR